MTESIYKNFDLKNKIAVRVPNNKCTLELLQKCNFLVGTSANVSGNPSYTNPEEGLQNLEGYDVFVDGGVISGKGESTIIEIENNEIRIIREGSLSLLCLQ